LVRWRRGWRGGRQGLLGALSTWRDWQTKTRVQERFRRAGNEGGSGSGGGNTEEKFDDPCQLKNKTE